MILYLSLCSDQPQVLERYSAGATVTLAFKDGDRAVAQIADYNRDYPLAGIIGVDDETTLIAATAAKALKLRHNEPESIAATRNKHTFRRRLANSGIPTLQVDFISAILASIALL